METTLYCSCPNPILPHTPHLGDPDRVIWKRPPTVVTQTLFNSLSPHLGDPDRVIWKRPPTAGYQFKTSVAALMQNLLCKAPNYIRCIKPNDNKRPGYFDTTIVRHQVRYLGFVYVIFTKSTIYTLSRVCFYYMCVIQGLHFI